MGDKLGGYMSWVPTMLNSSKERRQEWIESIIDAFKSLGPKKRDASVRYLSDVLSENKEFKFIGFVPKIEYIKADGPKNHMNVIFEHQHMNPTLLYKHKDLPVLIIAGPGIEWDEDQGIKG